MFLAPFSSFFPLGRKTIWKHMKKHIPTPLCLWAPHPGPHSLLQTGSLVGANFQAHIYPSAVREKRSLIPQQLPGTPHTNIEHWLAQANEVHSDGCLKPHVETMCRSGSLKRGGPDSATRRMKGTRQTKWHLVSHVPFSSVVGSAPNLVKLCFRWLSHYLSPIMPQYWGAGSTHNRNTIILDFSLLLMPSKLTGQVLTVILLIMLQEKIKHRNRNKT